MSAINMQKYRVPEKEYVHHVENTLGQIPADGKAILFFMCRKLAGFSDEGDRNVLIAYEAGNDDAKDLVLQFASEIAAEHFMLPSLMVNYIVVTMEEAKFMEMCALPEEQIENEDLRLVIRRYKFDVAENAKHTS